MQRQTWDDTTPQRGPSPTDEYGDDIDKDDETSKAIKSSRPRSVVFTKPNRLRHHVNPLQSFFQIPISTPDWSKVYADPSKPLHIDIGCGKVRLRSVCVCGIVLLLTLSC